MVDELACNPRSPTELAQGRHGFSYHQVNRRAGLFKVSGFLTEWAGPGRRRCYALTEKTRQAMGLITGIARWRHHHVVAEDEEGMTGEEMATALKTSIPLVRLPEHSGKCLKVEVLRGDKPSADEDEAIWAEVEEDGTVHSCADPSSSVDAWGRGRIAAWIPAILEGDSQRVLVGGEEGLVGDCLACLHQVLWTPSSS